MSDEYCQNCERKIGKLETPQLWGEAVVCAACYGHLSHSLPAAVSHPEAQPEILIEAEPSEMQSDYVDLSPATQTTNQQFVLQNVVHVHDYGNSRSSGNSGDPALAAILSFLIPGVGQMYLGKIGEGAIWLVATVVGYFCMIVPGIIIHLVCIISAATYRPPRKRRRY